MEDRTYTLTEEQVRFITALLEQLNIRPAQKDAEDTVRIVKSILTALC